MKKHFLFIVLFFFCIDGFSQLKYSGQWSTTLTTGVSIPQGFSVSTGIERYFANSAGSLLFELDYIHQEEFMTVGFFDISYFHATLSYVYSFDRLVRSPFFLNVGAGGLIGTEQFPSKDIPHGVIQLHGNETYYGISFKPQFEYLFSSRCSAIVQLEMNYLLQARFNDFIFNPSVGFKFYI